MNILKINYTLRPIVINDCQDLFELYTDENVVQFLDMQLFKTVTDAEAYIASILNDSSVYYAAIIDTTTNKLIGTCAIKYINTKHKFASISYALQQREQGKGIMKWALQELIRIAFNELNLNRLEAQIHIDNTNSVYLIEKMGFEREGLLRKNFLIKGIYYDSYMYSILKR